MELNIINPHLFQRSPYRELDCSFWQEYMRIAIGEAKKALKMGEVPVGALLIEKEKGILSSGFNSCITLSDPTAHAEVLVLRSGARILGNYRLNSSVLITTLEPCIMCFGAMIHARINGLVFGTADPKSGVIVSKVRALEEYSWLNHSFWVICGILAEDCSNILKEFFRSKR